MGEATGGIAFPVADRAAGGAASVTVHGAAATAAATSTVVARSAVALLEAFTSAGREASDASVLKGVAVSAAVPNLPAAAAATSALNHLPNKNGKKVTTSLHNYQLAKNEPPTKKHTSTKKTSSIVGMIQP